MGPGAQDALLDAALPGWRTARLVSGQRETLCPLHDDHSPSLHVREDARTWICRAGCGSGGAWTLATRALGVDRAREIVREIDDGTTPRNGRAGSPRIADRPTPKVETPDEDAEARRREAVEIWRSAKQASPSHPYLRCKGIQPHGLSQQGENLVAPIHDADGRIQSIQRITPEGKKLNLKGAAREGGHWLIGEIEKSDTAICIVEGVSTGASVYEATGFPTVVAYGAGNLRKVAVIIRGNYPEAKILICADNDPAGSKAASDAAVAVRARVAIPSAEGHDWNDVHRADGLDAVREAIEAALSAENVEPEAAQVEIVERDEWPEPIELDTETYGPDLALEALPPVLGDYIESVARAKQVPADLVVGCVLATLAGAAAGRARVAVGESHEEPLNLYAMGVAAPGERKSVAIREATRPVEEFERELIETMRSTVTEAREAREIAVARLKKLRDNAAKKDDPTERAQLVAEAQQAAKEIPPLLPMPRLLIDDATPEAVAKVLAEQGGRLMLASEEAGSLLATMRGRYTSGASTGDVDIYLKAYDGGSIRVDRVSAGREAVRIESPCLAVLVTAQPSLLRDLGSDADLRGRGLLGRFCFVVARPLVGLRPHVDLSIDRAAQDAYERAVRSILELPVPRPGEIPLLRLEGEALRLWIEAHDEIESAMREGGELESVRDWASKHAARVARVAALFHLLRHAASRSPWAVPIDAEDVAAARVVGEWLTAHALAAVGMVGADPRVAHARKLLRWIQRERCSDFSERDAYRSAGLDRERELPEALSMLLHHEHIREAPLAERRPQGGRRQSRRFAVNPRTNCHNCHNCHNCGAGTGSVSCGSSVTGVQP